MNKTIKENGISKEMLQRLNIDDIITQNLGNELLGDKTWRYDL